MAKATESKPKAVKVTSSRSSSNKQDSTSWLQEIMANPKIAIALAVIVLLICLMLSCTIIYVTTVIFME